METILTKQLLYDHLLKVVNSDHDKSELGYHAYDISCEDYQAIRVDNKEIGSFAVYKYPDTEVYNIITDQWEWTGEPDYIFDGFYHDDFPEVTINQALKCLKFNEHENL